MSTSVMPFQLDCFGVHIYMQFTSPISQHIFLGYALRGMLGQALFNEVCIYSKPQCSECALRMGCAYPQVFKPSELKETHARLPAYVIHNWTLDTQYSVRFSILIFGSAVRYLEVWLVSLLRVNGLLQLSGAEQGRIIELSDLSCSKSIMAKNQLVNQVMPMSLSTDYTSSAKLTLHTLFATKHQKKDFLFAALRTRLRRLLADYGQGDWPMDIQAWQMELIKLKPGTVRVNHQRRVNGVSGYMVLQDISPEAYTLLSLGQLIHAGADAVAGLGRFTFVRS